MKTDKVLNLLSGSLSYIVVVVLCVLQALVLSAAELAAKQVHPPALNEITPLFQSCSCAASIRMRWTEQVGRYLKWPIRDFNLWLCSCGSAISFPVQ